MPPGVLYNLGYPSEVHLKLKSREVSFAHNLFRICPIDSTFCTENSSITVVLSEN